MTGTVNGSAQQPLIRIGAVGAGRMGAQHIENMLNTRFVEVSAVCTPMESEVEWTKKNVPEAKIYKDIEDMVKDPNVDAVWLSSPTALHKEHVFKSLEAGKHVFCEKPLAMNPTDAWEVYHKAQEYPHLKTACGFPRRFVPAYQEAARRIQNGELGEIISIKNTTSDKYDGSEAFNNYIKTSGGCFVDSMIHCIDATLFLVGDDKIPERAYATGSTKVYPQFADYGDTDNAHGILDFKDGFIATFYGSRNNQHGHHTTVEINGTKANLSLHVDPRVLSIDIHDKDGTRIMNAKDQMALFYQAYADEVTAFRDWVLFDKQSNFNFKDAAKAVSIAQALQQSLRSRQPVTEFEAI